MGNKKVSISRIYRGLVILLVLIFVIIMTNCQVSDNNITKLSQIDPNISETDIQKILGQANWQGMRLTGPQGLSLYWTGKEAPFNYRAYTDSCGKVYRFELLWARHVNKLAKMGNQAEFKDVDKIYIGQPLYKIENIFGEALCVGWDATTEQKSYIYPNFDGSALYICTSYKNTQDEKVINYLYHQREYIPVNSPPKEPSKEFLDELDWEGKDLSFQPLSGYQLIYPKYFNKSLDGYDVTYSIKDNNNERKIVVITELLNEMDSRTNNSIMEDYVLKVMSDFPANNVQEIGEFKINNAPAIAYSINESQEIWYICCSSMRLYCIKLISDEENLLNDINTVKEMLSDMKLFEVCNGAGIGIDLYD